MKNTAALLLSLVCGLGATALAPDAHATVPTEEGGGFANVFYGVGASPFIALSLGLGIADAVYAANGEWAPTPLAVTEIVGGALSGAAGVLVTALTIHESAGAELSLGLGLGLSVVGPALLGHGIASLVLGGDQAPEATINVVPTKGGAAGSLTLRF